MTDAYDHDTQVSKEEADLHADDCRLCEITRLRAEVERLKLVDAAHDFTESVLEHERDEALAQVAVLLQRLQEEHCQSETCDLHATPYAEARALLDRLALLEDGSLTNTRLVWLEKRLQRAEALVEAAKAWDDAPMRDWSNTTQALKDALAAWEEKNK